VRRTRRELHGQRPLELLDSLEQEREEAIARAGEAARERDVAREQARHSELERETAEQDAQSARKDAERAEQGSGDCWYRKPV
jgi:thioesterase domain-containing protein